MRLSERRARKEENRDKFERKRIVSIGIYICTFKKEREKCLNNSLRSRTRLATLDHTLVVPSLTAPTLILARWKLASHLFPGQPQVTARLIDGRFDMLLQ